MSGARIKWFLSHLNFVSLSVPIGVLLVGVFFPLRPIHQQGLILIILVWFGVEWLWGFPFWK